jgi:hypothetical protein
MTEQMIDVGQLAQALVGLAGQQRTKAVSSTPRSSGYAHGVGGLMSAPGMTREVINAMILPYTGLASMLPSYPNNDANPLYGIITGQTAGSGSNPSGVCDDPPQAGLLKLCTYSSSFGRYSLQTPVIDIDRVGMTTNRGEFWDYQSIGDPFSPQGVTNIGPTVPGGMSLQNALNQEIAKAMFELAVEWTRRYGPLLYTGNPAKNTAGGGYKEFRGLDILINTGYRDAESTQLCSASDSIVANFASQNVSTANTNIVATLTNIIRRLKINARGNGLWPVKWVMVMREALFYELTQIWACSYATYRCQNQFSATQVNNIDSRDIMTLRQQMRGDMMTRSGQYLLMDDEPISVVFDDYITETSLGNGAFNSSIYIVPLTVIGNRPVTYIDYINYDMPNGALAAARAMAPQDSFFATDAGRFLWHKKPPTNFCVQALVKGEPRLVLRTPHIAARLTNVAYTPLEHERDWNPTGYYFVNGGRTDRNGYSPSFWSPVQGYN